MDKLQAQEQRLEGIEEEKRTHTEAIKELEGNIDRALSGMATGIIDKAKGFIKRLTSDGS